MAKKPVFQGFLKGLSYSKVEGQITQQQAMQVFDLIEKTGNAKSFFANRQKEKQMSRHELAYSLAAEIRLGTHNFLFAFHKGKPVGLARYDYSVPGQKKIPSLNIHQMMVLPEHKSGGIELKMALHLLGHANANGLDFNLRAQSFDLHAFPNNLIDKRKHYRQREILEYTTTKKKSERKSEFEPMETRQVREPDGTYRPRKDTFFESNARTLRKNFELRRRKMPL